MSRRFLALLAAVLFTAGTAKAMVCNRYMITNMEGDGCIHGYRLMYQDGDVCMYEEVSVIC